MADYLVTASYSSEGVKGVLKSGGTARAEAVSKAVQGLGGKMRSFHFAFGGDDAVVIVELPDNVAAAALGLAVSSTSGRPRNARPRRTLGGVSPIAGYRTLLRRQYRAGVGVVAGRARPHGL